MDLSRRSSAALLLLLIVCMTLVLVEGKNKVNRRKCKTPKTCKKLQGKCQASESCSTLVLKGGGCPGTCGCCVKKAKKCKPKVSCTNAGGFCVKKPSSCEDGAVITGACKCKKKKTGYCCIPPQPTWSYNGTDGPTTWKENWPQCDEDLQSPINVDTTIAMKPEITRGFGKPEPILPPVLEFTHFDRKDKKIEVENNGNLVNMKWKDAAKPFVSGGGLDDAYLLDHIQFHWGSDNTIGSEHAVDNKKSALEVQLYHYKASYGSMEKALEEEDGVAALAVMYQISTENNTALAEMLDQTPPDTVKTEMQYRLPFSSLLPEDTSTFYRYMGSLTQPGCEESVIWTLFADSANVSDYQLNQFRQFLNSEGGAMQDNYRPLQPLGDREVFLYETKKQEKANVNMNGTSTY